MKKAVGKHRLGQTRLYSGQSVSKDHPILNACGDLDELGAILGLAWHHLRGRAAREAVRELAQRLLVVGAELAVGSRRASVRGITADDVRQLAERIRELKAHLPTPTGFVVCASTLGAAWLHLARAVARRCERDIVRIYRRQRGKRSPLLEWINLLSNYLWWLACAEERAPRRTRKP